MKKFLVACLLALPVTAFSHKEASAWCSWNFNFGFNISCGHSCGCGPDCGGMYPSYDMGGYSSFDSYPGYYGSYSGLDSSSTGYDVGQTTPSVRNHAAKTQPAQYAPTWNAGSGYLPVGYGYTNPGYGSYYGYPYSYGYGQ